MIKEQRLIDANALKEKAEPEEVTGEGIVYVQDIDEAPTVDAVEVVHGHFENITGGMVMLGNCSECNVRQPVIETYYCKNCGAKMDGGINK